MKGRGGSKDGSKQNEKVEQQSVLFVEQTVDGELAKRLRELMIRMNETIGFSVKVVERAGSTLKSKFLQSRLWEGMQCGRNECITCNQGAEFLAPCTKKWWEPIQISHLSMWGKPHAQYRRGEQNTGQPAEVTRSRKMGATSINIWSSNTKERSRTSC